MSALIRCVVCMGDLEVGEGVGDALIAIETRSKDILGDVLISFRIIIPLSLYRALITLLPASRFCLCFGCCVCGI